MKKGALINISDAPMSLRTSISSLLAYTVSLIVFVIMNTVADARNAPTTKAAASMNLKNEENFLTHSEPHCTSSTHCLPLSLSTTVRSSTGSLYVSVTLISKEAGSGFTSIPSSIPCCPLSPSLSSFKALSFETYSAALTPGMESISFKILSVGAVEPSFT